MATTSEPVTFSELQTDFLSRVRAASGTVDVEVAKRLLNTALVNMHINPGHKFPWAERRGVLITHAPYTTGTVSITTATSRTAVTGVNTLWNTAVTGYGFNNARAGGKIRFAGTGDNYTVSSVASDTSLTLLTNYVGDDLSGVTYTYFEDEYALAADFLRFVDLRMFSTDMNIPLISATDFRRWFPRNDTTQRPKAATQIQLGYSGSTTPRYRVVLHPVPADEYQIPYWYVTTNLAVSTAGVEQDRMSAATDEPIVPRGKRQAISLYAMYEYYRDYKDDVRATMVRQEYEQLMTRISGEMNATDSRPQFYVRNSGRGIRRQRFDYGNRFDEVKDR